MKLYELTDAFQELFVDEEMTETEISEKLQDLNMELDAKVADGIGLLKNLKSMSDAMNVEIQRLTLRKKSLENKISKIKDYYQSELSAMGKKKVLRGCFHKK